MGSGGAGRSRIQVILFGTPRRASEGGSGPEVKDYCQGGPLGCSRCVEKRDQGARGFECKKGNS